MLGHEPDLQLVAPDHIADDQIVGAIVSAFGGEARHRAGSCFSWSVLLLAQHLVYERDRNRTFAYRGRHPLDIAAADVAHRKDAWPARFEQIRSACEWPFRTREFLEREFLARLHEALLVENDAAVHPRRVRNGARHDE